VAVEAGLGDEDADGRGGHGGKYTLGCQVSPVG